MYFVCTLILFGFLISNSSHARTPFTFVRKDAKTSYESGGGCGSTASQAVSFTAAGAGTWTVPSCVTEITIEGIGAGAGGENGAGSQGGGGGGGGYARSTITVTVGQTIYYHVGTGGAVDNDGEDSWVNVSVNSAPSTSASGIVAARGLADTTGGGAGANVNIGQTTSPGGNGAPAQGGGGARAGSGGGGGGTDPVNYLVGIHGKEGSGSFIGGGGTPNVPDTGPYGSWLAGAYGANGAGMTTNAAAGVEPGGGGGGTSSDTGLASAGANGRIRILYVGP